MRIPILGAWAAILTAGCSQPTAPHVINETLRAISAQPDADSLACARCHPAIFDEWVGSQHARANRLVADEHDREAFEPATEIEHGSFVTRMRREGKDRFTFATAFSNQPQQTFRAEAVIGVTPLRQYLVTHPGGRLQVMDMSYDPRSNEWFNAFGDENRQPHEWGHWSGRSMNWNARCAFCHMTGFEKNYDHKSDSYASTWRAMGISCTQCHVVKGPVSTIGDRCPVSDRAGHSAGEGKMRAQENCASCHARREELFGTFKPGDSFYDHFRLALPDEPGVFQSDGQVREEDFEYASFMLSRMGHKGVTCMDCHNPHSGRLLAPVDNNALCLKCHTPPGLNGAIPIDPVGHSFHPPGTTGSRCVECHMPQNVYMVRDARRDHGFTTPDPKLTIEHGIPNACNRCHTDQSAKWADEWTSKWYGEKMNRRARDRARLVARYHAGDATVSTQLQAMASSEEIAAWRAALVGMLHPWAGQEPIATFLRSELSHPHPLVRSAAIRSLQDASDANLHDSVALVRVDAVLARHMRYPNLPPPTLDELRAYIDNISDQPAGAMRQAQLAAVENHPHEAEAWVKKAIAWDPTSPSPYHELGHLQFAAGQQVEGISNLYAAAAMDAQNAEYSFSLALALAEHGHHKLALSWLEETVRRDATLGRAWYNLGLAYAAAERLPEALEALSMADQLLPESPDPSYARATIFIRQNKPDQAVEAALKALQLAPHHTPALRLLRSIAPAKRIHENPN